MRSNYDRDTLKVFSSRSYAIKIFTTRKSPLIDQTWSELARGFHSMRQRAELAVVAVVGLAEFSCV
jgi:hypothetical protein